MAKFEFNPLLEKLRITFDAGEGSYDFFYADDGVKLFYRYYIPPKIEKIIIVAHGAGGNGDYYILLADQVFNENIAVYVMDYRGHGYSEGKKGDIKKFENILNDFDKFIILVKQQHPKIPIFLFGESMGAPVIINYLSNYDININGVILFSPAVKIKIKFSVKQILMVVPLALIYLFAPGACLISMNQGRDSTGIANPIHLEYDKTDDLHLKKISIRYLLTLNSIIKKAFNCAENINHPILLVQGEIDPSIDLNGVKDFFERISSNDKQLIIIPNGTHALFTDPNANSTENNIWDILRDWLRRF
ncbi:MAG: alpha/beta fold hydrolase [Candidatus Helarchaeota archaeon]